MAFPPGAVPGIDVSHHQEVVNWPAVASAGEVFAYAKASEGGSIPDMYFADNWSGMKAAGILRGAYHFFPPATDAAAQAAFFLKRFANANAGSTKLAPGDLPAMLDLEVTDAVAPTDIVAGAAKWLAAVEQSTGRKPLLYTSIDFWRNKLNNPKDLSAYPLWIAQYNTTPPHAPGGWNNWTFWQFSEKQSISGVSGLIDADAFNGTIDAQRQLAGY